MKKSIFIIILFGLILTGCLKSDVEPVIEPVTEPIVEPEPIIVEILIFIQNHAKNDVLFITGDLNPFLVARDKEIPTVNWRDQKYKEILHKKKIKDKKPPNLEILFDVEEGKKEIELFTKGIEPDFLKFENSRRNPSTMMSNYKINQEIFDKVVEGDGGLATQ